MIKLLSISCFILSSLPLIAQKSSKAELVAQLTGTFNSSNGDVEQRIEMVPIWQSEEVDWIYQETIWNSNKKEPQFQRILRIDEDGKNKYSLILFDLPETTPYIQGYKKPEQAFAELSKDDLTEKDGCAIRLIFADGKFIGNIQEPCDSSLEGAMIETIAVEIWPDRLVYHQQGWDDKGQLKWGPQEATNFDRK